MQLKKAVINGRYEVDLTLKLGDGAFGAVYAGKNALTGEEVAVKIEYPSSSLDSKDSVLSWEYGVYEYLRDANIQGIPRVYQYRQGVTLTSQGEVVSLMIMERLGSSLQTVMKQRIQCPRLGDWPIFSVPEVLRIGSQLVSILEQLHCNSIIHCDLKPSNIAYEMAKRPQKVFLIDYGLAKRFRHVGSLEHLLQAKAQMSGTPCFTSIDSHRGLTLARRDDMESLGYVLAYLHRGWLPWQAVSENPHDNGMKQMYEMKCSVPLEEICGFCLPLCKYLRSVKKLSFDESPDYDQLRRDLDIDLSSDSF